MKRIILMATAFLTTLTSMAEGYQINTLSAKQEGMGHVGVGMKLGAESMIFNPAGLGFSDKTFEITGSFTGIKAIASAEWDGGKQTTDNGWSTPLAFNASFKINKNLQAGVSFFTPYGSAINWGKDWEGAALIQDVKLQTFTVQPSIAWRITDKLSVGAGFMISWGNVDLNKAVLTGGMVDPLLAGMGLPAGIGYGNQSPLSLNIMGNAEPAFGVNLGVMYDINDKWTVGASWRSKQMMKVNDGDTKLTYNTAIPALANNIAGAELDAMVHGLLQQNFGALDGAKFKAEMPMPQVIQAGVSFKPNKNLILAFDAQYTGWGTYKNLAIQFPDLDPMFSQNLPKNYSDSWTFHLGGQYTLNKHVDLRAGLMIDTTPCDENYYSPETPGMTKIEPTVGCSYRPVKNLSIAVSFMYVAGLGMDDAKGSYNNPIQKTVETFEADYSCRAFIPSIGLSYSF